MTSLDVFCATSGIKCVFTSIFARRLLKINLKLLITGTAGKSISYEPFADQLIKETRFTWPSADQTFVNSTMRSAIARMVIYPLADFGILEYEYKEKTSDGYKSKYLAEIRLTSVGKGLLETL